GEQVRDRIRILRSEPLHASVTVCCPLTSTFFPTLYATLRRGRPTETQLPPFCLARMRASSARCSSDASPVTRLSTTPKLQVTPTSCLRMTASWVRICSHRRSASVPAPARLITERRIANLPPSH